MASVGISRLRDNFSLSFIGSPMELYDKQGGNLTNGGGGDIIGFEEGEKLDDTN